MSDETDNNSFRLGLTSINEVIKRIDYIVDEIFVFFYRWLYNIVHDVKLLYPGKFLYLEKFHIMIIFHFLETFHILENIFNMSFLVTCHIFNTQV